ncbi:MULTISPECIES: sugar ABC transporter ATP-binding protein [Exiguobacterium]|uniref:Ribose import ATP-binding protein RbsA n=1 Tax=Exiguobacterium aurantiacum TaxID=33987 RepID=A0A377FQ23_9BACL|nr:MULTISPECIES: sugar ABC transporter ATP-binding protein [Exiguobacterium]STO06930.1 Ribose import ATP-binding protein RbsA [Exiguobacterium aurantiacum]
MHIELKRIHKSFGPVSVLKGVDFELLPGEIHALMGENGAGKSTLMKVMTGLHAQDEGEVVIDGAVRQFKHPKEAEREGIAFIHQELNILPELTVTENLFLGRELTGAFGVIKQQEMKRRAREYLAELNVFMEVDELAKNLSVGQQQMIEIAKALMTDAKVIVMDEPTAALTDREIRALFAVSRALRDQGVSIIYISHRMEEIFELCDRITVLRDGLSIGTHRIVDTSFEEIVKEMVGREIGERYPDRTATIGDVVLEVNGLIGNRFHNVSFDVRAGEIVGFSGLMGAGRTEVMRALFGADRAKAGVVKLNGKEVRIKKPADAIAHGIAFLTEDRKGEGLLLDFSLRENLSLPTLDRRAKGTIISRQAEEEFADGYLKKLRVKHHSMEQKVKSLSGGNQQKVVLGKWLGVEPDVLILDEPTRGVDVGAKKEIYTIMSELAESGVAIIMVSSDLPEVLGMSDRIVVMREGVVTGTLAKHEATQERVMTYATGGQ